jgi:molybdopterin-guanine dinucleotide biosynthesis protein A
MPSHPLELRGAIVLCGGSSTRMGRDKAWIPFGEEAMLQRMVRLLSEAAPAQNIVVVAGANQRLPNLPPDVQIARDEQSNQGPLPAVSAGLRLLLKKGVNAAFVTACDFPLLKPEFVTWLLDALEVRQPTEGQAYRAVVPGDSERLHPLSAAYSCSCSEALNAAVAGADSIRASNSLHAALRSGLIELQCVPVDELRRIDPQLHSLKNCNTPEDYRQALAEAGFTATD